MSDFDRIHRRNVRCARAAFSLALAWLVTRPATTVAGAPDGGRVEFARDVRPILSDNCFKCHGPDEAARRARLRLDVRESAGRVLTSTSNEPTELLRRITSNDPDERMPPPESKLSLTPAEVDTVRRWVERGAPYASHWAFTPIRQVAVPAVRDRLWPRNEIDRFILARLERRGLSPAPGAPRDRLIRRLAFDLTGLPPGPGEIEAFLSDRSPDAYDRLVDRLLAHPGHGERMTADWLDVARYSDSYGYQVDRDRFVWPWRDWVIRAFNEDLPYDEFLTWQIAGDLLAGATDEQILATTFNRLHPQKVEGGSVPEEFRIEYVADRTHTLGTAVLGLSLQCARCHDHKYDPISQREYYQLFAFFNQIDEAGLYSYFTSSVPTPTLLLVDDATRARIAAIERRIADAESALEQTALARDASLEAWLARGPHEPSIPGQIAYLDFEKPPGGANRTVAGRIGRAVELTGDDGIGLDVGNFARYEPFSVALWMRTPDLKERAVIFHRSRAWTDAGSRGYQLLIESGHLSASLIHFWPGNAIRVRMRAPIPTREWLHVVVTYDGSSRADGLRIWLNGDAAPVDVIRDGLTKNIRGGGGDTITIGERFRDRGFARGQVDEFRVFDRELTAIEVAQIHDGKALSTLLARIECEGPSASGGEALRAYYLSTIDDVYRRRLEELCSAREDRSEAMDGLREIMVMREPGEIRQTFLLRRGAYDAPVEPVQAETPDVLPPFPTDAPRNRLGLARWLTAPENPLTARVAVNRLWQLCFGQGLVRTPEDFGSQGEPPTHPELLDWLAGRFIRKGWNTKRLLREIVLSATYRQSSRASSELLALDPTNRLLARAPRYRLAAEMLRDNALAASGLLVRRIGGPPAKPYEVEESFKPVKRDTGSGLYRRSVYTYWKRTGPAPVMMALDAAKRDVCVVKREQTSSPLQALVLLNSPQFIEAARVLARDLLERHDRDLDGALDELFRRLTSRRPTPQERAILRSLHAVELRYFEEHPDRAREFLETGDAPVAEAGADPRIAALGVVANALMGFDECVVKR